MVITLIDVLIKYQVIDLNKLLLKIYPKLGLLPQEGVMLLHFLSFYQQNQQKSFKISLLALKNKTGLSEAEIKKLITELEKKEFIDVTLNAAPSGKREEYYGYALRPRRERNPDSKGARRPYGYIAVLYLPS